MAIYSKNHHYFLLVHVVMALFGSSSMAAQGQELPAFFVLGDSLVEVGNNNYIATIAKANNIPWGIDFIDRKPTGRFTNGRTIIDLIGQELGVKDFIPPYLAPSTSGDVVLHGVNYASGAAGILNETGRNYGGRINMDAQLDNFAKTRQYITSRMGDPAAASKLLNEAIFTTCIGSNDFINNYLLTPIRRVPPQAFVDTMISRYRLQLTRLYDLDARKIVIANVGPIGCIPQQRDQNPSAGESCVAFVNELVAQFNDRLKSLVMELSSSLVGSKFVYADVYSILFDILNNFQSYGFENFDSACCRLAGRFGGLVPCIPISRVCPDRSKYVFWDNYHPSEAANVVIAKRLLDGDSKDIYPMNVRQLVY